MVIAALVWILMATAVGVGWRDWRGQRPRTKSRYAHMLWAWPPLLVCLLYAYATGLTAEVVFDD